MATEAQRRAYLLANEELRILLLDGSANTPAADQLRDRIATLGDEEDER